MNTTKLVRIEDRLTELVSAFPEGDIRGHRMYHDALIRKEEEKREAWQNIKAKTLGGLLLLAITSSVTWVYTHFKDIVTVTLRH